MVDDAPDGVTVQVVDDHPVERRGLMSLLATESWVTLVIEAGTVREARAVATVDHHHQTWRLRPGPGCPAGPP